MATGLFASAERVDRRLNALLESSDASSARAALLRLLEAVGFEQPDHGAVQLMGDGLPPTAERAAVGGGVHAILLIVPEKGRVLMRLVRQALKEVGESLAGEAFLVAGSVESGEWQFIWPSDAGEKQIIRRIALHRGSPHRTVAEQLAKVYDDALKLGMSEALNRAYNVEAVTKAFFDDYARIFHEAETRITGIEDAPQRRMFCQRLFNRLMFIYFLQRKGWLKFGERTDYLDALWADYRNSPDLDGLNFYDGRLKYLFFHGLNSEHARDVHGLLAARIGAVPFLNGGLFERAEVDNLPGVGVPDDMFPMLFRGLFHRYNFTITESTPYDVQVAVDPEMLGKVFEKLVTGRHESGSYYTPRPIVSFMCREALKGYLQRRVSDLGKQTVEAYVERHDVAAIDRSQASRILDALGEIAVADPACGSGAYLLGMMQELLDLQTILFNPGLLDSPKSVYDMKLDIIQRNLYGVDIDEFAVNIAMLRLWLALVVEYEGDGDPPALPNLDFKIVQGDSIAGPDPDEREPDLIRARTHEMALELSELKGNYLRSTGEEKNTFRRLVEALEGELSAMLAHSNVPHNALDWRVAFAEVFERGGFDAVVANPPYVRHESITEQKPRLREVYGPLYSGTADLYVYFYYRAFQVLREGGMLVFISSNKWFKAAYGAKLRERIASSAAIWSVTDFGELPVFEAATFPMIFVAQLGGEQSGATAFTQVKSLTPPYPDVSKLIADLGSPLPAGAITGGEWRLTDAATIRRLERMRVGTVPLGEYVGGKIYRGVLTGLNKAFVIDGATRDALIAADANSAEIIKPFVVGKDIRRWSVRHSDRYIILTKIGTDMSRYPAIFEHLSRFQPELEKRWDRGEHWWELRACAYYDAFETVRVVYPDISIAPKFALAPAGTYVINTVYMACAPEAYLAAILNSASAWEFMSSTFTVLGDAQERGRVRLFTQDLEKTPVPSARPADRSAIEQLAERCIRGAEAGEDVAELEAEIDDRVARLYGLDGQEA